jgi:hypothetical protein
MSQLTLVPSPVCSSTAPFTGSPRHSSELGGPIFCRIAHFCTHLWRLKIPVLMS